MGSQIGAFAWHYTRRKRRVEVKLQVRHGDTESRMLKRAPVLLVRPGRQLEPENP